MVVSGFWRLSGFGMVFSDGFFVHMKFFRLTGKMIGKRAVNLVIETVNLVKLIKND